MSYSRQFAIVRNSIPLQVGLVGLAGLVASAIFVQYMARRAETAHKPRGKLLQLGNSTVHVVDRGSGPPVVVLHGNGSMVEDPLSSGVTELLAQGHRVIAIDRPGFGLSTRDQSGEWTPEREAQLLAHLIKSMGLDRPIIVAHSWATLTALALALEEPDSVSGLVLVSGYYYPTVRADVAIQSIVSIPVIGHVLRNTVLPLLSRASAPLAFKKMFAPLKVSREFVSQYSVSMAARPSHLKSLANDTATMPKAAKRLSARYAELQLPIVLIAGSEDHIVSPGHHSERLHDELPNSSLEIVHGGSHMLLHANPYLVERRVKGLLEREPGPIAASV